MTKGLSIFVASAATLGALWAMAGAQTPQTLQGVPLKANQKINVEQHLSLASAEQSFSFDDITNWTGEGENQAAFVVQFDDVRQPEALVYGYRWDGDEATGADMIEAIVENNPQLFALYQTTSYGCTLAGMGFDRYNDGAISVSYADANVTLSSTTGWFDIGNYSYSYYGKFTADDESDMWNSGFGYSGEGYWSYYVGTSFSALSYSNYGLASRKLTDGCIDAWCFSTKGKFGTLVAAPSVIDEGVEKQFNDLTLNYAVLNNDTKTVAVMPSDDFSYEGNIVIPATVERNGSTYTVTEIANMAFCGCAFESVTIPATVKVIGSYAFYGSTVTSIEVESSTPITLADEAFGEDVLAAATLTVPAGCADAYLTDSQWGAFSQIIEKAAENTDAEDGISDYIDFNQINVWVGEGSNQAALMLTFGDDKGMDNLVLGVRFDGNATVESIIASAVENFARLSQDDNGLTYDLNGDGSFNETYEHSLANSHYFIDHANAFEEAEASSSVANKDIVYVSANEAPVYPAYKFYIPTDDNTGIWTLDEYEVNVSSTAQTFPIYLNVGSSSCSSMTATYTNEEGATDSTKATVALANAAKGNARATITTKAMGTIFIKVRAKINNAFTDYTPACKVTIAGAVNQIEQITYSGDSNDITIDELGVVQIPTSKFTISPSTADFKTLSYSVSDPEIVYVYSNQYYIGSKVGECDLTVSATDGSGVSTNLHFTVKERERIVPEDNYQDGVFMLNEDWFGHAPGSINYFDAERQNVYLNAYETNNRGFNFGNTAQFAQIFGDRLYVSSKKSEIDNVEQNGLLGGGRIIIADANTLKFITEFETGGNDGRAIAGVSADKVYAGMSKNIRVINVDNENNTFTLGNTITTNEVRGIEVAQSKAFVFDFTSKDSKVTVVDVNTDQIITTLGSSIIGIAQSADGNIWLAQANKLFCYDPATLDLLQEVDVPTAAKVTDKGAGYPDRFCASPKENVLFWLGSSGVFRWEIGSDLPTAPLAAVTGYYSTLDYDCKSDQIIVAVANYTPSGNCVKFINATTGEINNFDMPDYFWFPSMPVMTDKYAAEFSTDNIEVLTSEDVKTIDLREYVTDLDNNDSNIVIALNGDNAISSNGYATISYEDEILTVSPINIGSETVSLTAESNGRITEHTLTVTITDQNTSANDIAADNRKIKVNGSVFTFIGYADTMALIYNANGQMLKAVKIDTNNYSVDLGIAAGVYFVKTSDGAVKKAVVK